MNSERVTELPRIDLSPNRLSTTYIQTAAAFIAEDDPQIPFIIAELLPLGVILLVHGEPRARKSLVALELALAAATGTAAFGLRRFTPAEPVTVLYVQEEDPRNLTRPRLRALIQARCGEPPDTLHVAIRRGINLDDPAWVERLIYDLQHRSARLLVLDAARRLSALTDEGPAKVRELTSVLRSIVTETGVSIVIVHHDVKPPSTGQDQRRRSQRASGGDWFSACESPVHVGKLNQRESLVFPEDYKFSFDPAPFTFKTEITNGLITRLVGTDTDTGYAERAGVCGRVLDWLHANGPATRTDMKKAGLGRWETIESTLEFLQTNGNVDSAPGRKAGSRRYFVPGESSPRSGDGSGEHGK
jgi:hypothetical protein